MRQHVRGGPGSAPGSLIPLAFWSRVVTSGLPQPQGYKQRKLYSFVTRLLQICANVKSTSLRRGRRERECKCPRRRNNPFIFNTVQGYRSSIPKPVKRNARADFREETTVSTAFSTEDRVSNLKEEESPEDPQVSKNRGFACFYSTVTSSKANHAPQMARGPRRSRAGSMKRALKKPRTP
jgi:hypothetical protein